VFAAATAHELLACGEELHLVATGGLDAAQDFASQVGLPLFERIRSQDYLTPAGEKLLHCARLFTSASRKPKRRWLQLKGVTGGRLNVAVISAGDYFFPRVLAASVRHPGSRVNLTVHNREGLLRPARRHLTDLAVMVRPPRDLDIVAMPFAPHPMSLCSTQPPARPARQIPRAALTGSASLQREEGSDTWIQCAKCSVGSFPPQHRHGDSQHRNHQAGGGRRHGHRVLSAHTIGLDLLVGKPGGARCAGLSGHAEWYLGAQPHQAPAAVAAAFKDF